MAPAPTRLGCSSVAELRALRHETRARPIGAGVRQSLEPATQRLRLEPGMGVREGPRHGAAGRRAGADRGAARWPLAFTARAMRPAPDTYVLCEINVSSCFEIPDEAPAAIATGKTIGESAPATPRTLGVLCI
jgi:hypothetical protein